MTDWPTIALLGFWSPGPSEMLLLALVALLLYGGDLPEVARSWAKTFNEFRRNLMGIQNEINSAIYAEPEPTRRLQYYPEFHHDEARRAPSSEAAHGAAVAASGAVAAAGAEQSAAVEAAVGDEALEARPAGESLVPAASDADHEADADAAERASGAAERCDEPAA